MAGDELATSADLVQPMGLGRCGVTAVGDDGSDESYAYFIYFMTFSFRGVPSE